MRLVLIAIGLSFIFLFSGEAISKNKLIYYDDQIVTLSGVTSFKVFPGPPNYESIADGDIREGAIFLTLDKSIDVTASPNAPYFRRDERENNVKILHVANNDDKYWPLLRSGHHIKITGTLFHRLTGHHRTRVLINVIKVDPFEMKKNESKVSSAQRRHP